MNAARSPTFQASTWRCTTAATSASTLDEVERVVAQAVRKSKKMLEEKMSLATGSPLVAHAVEALGEAAFFHEGGCACRYSGRSNVPSHRRPVGPPESFSTSGSRHAAESVFPAHSSLVRLRPCVSPLGVQRAPPTTRTIAVDPGIFSPPSGSVFPPRYFPRNASARALKSVRFSGRAKPCPSSG